MKRLIIAVAVLACALTAAQADTFGTDENQFTIEFVTIAGDASSANGTNISQFSPGDPRHRTFTDPGYNYRMGVYEITNDQWDKFKAELDTPVTGDPADAYDEAPTWAGTDVPTNEVSWYEAAQFVNWLNTSTGYQAAYNFYETTPGDPATLVFDVWTEAEAAGGTNLYRHKDALYFLPTEDEWVKAAYWDGASLQTYAMPGDTAPVAGADSNYSSPHGQPWDVGSGSEELNGTFDMMGNVWEWMESPDTDPNYGAGSDRGMRGGSYGSSSDIQSTYRDYHLVYWEGDSMGFRVAEVPEPATMGLLSLGGLALLRRKRA